MTTRVESKSEGRPLKAEPIPTRHPSGAESADRSSDQQERENRVAVAAYFRAKARGFEPGQELDDWLAAEAEVGGLHGAGDAEIDNVGGGKDVRLANPANRR